MKAATRDVSLFVRYLFAVCIKALGSPSSCPESIMTTLFSASEGEELGREKCEKGEARKLKLELELLALSLFIEHDRFCHGRIIYTGLPGQNT